MIIVNKVRHKPTLKDFYVGRPSSLGNPYGFQDGTLAEHKVAGRAEAISSYREWLEEKINNPFSFGHEAVVAAMRMLKDDTVLVCWCDPLPCHGQVIKELWEKYFACKN